MCAIEKIIVMLNGFMGVPPGTSPISRVQQLMFNRDFSVKQLVTDTAKKFDAVLRRGRSNYVASKRYIAVAKNVGYGKTWLQEYGVDSNSSRSLTTARLVSSGASCLPMASQ